MRQAVAHALDFRFSKSNAPLQCFRGINRLASLRYCRSRFDSGSQRHSKPLDCLLEIGDEVFLRLNTARLLAPGRPKVVLETSIAGPHYRNKVVFVFSLFRACVLFDEQEDPQIVAAERLLSPCRNIRPRVPRDFKISLYELGVGMLHQTDGDVGKIGGCG